MQSSKATLIVVLCALSFLGGIVASLPRYHELQTNYNGIRQSLIDAIGRSERLEARLADLERSNAELRIELDNLSVNNQHAIDEARSAVARISTIQDRGERIIRLVDAIRAIIRTISPEGD